MVVLRQVHMSVLGRMVMEEAGYGLFMPNLALDGLVNIAERNRRTTASHVSGAGG